MKKNVIAITVLFSLAPILCLRIPVMAQVDQNIAPSEPMTKPVPSQNPAAPPPLAKSEVGKNTIGPSISLGGGAAIGVDSRFGISENLSLRPFIYFGNGGTDFGTALTYDINLRTANSSNKFTPFIGGAVDIATGNSTSVTTASLVAGTEYDLTDTIQLKASVNVPLTSSQGQSTDVTIGAGFRF
jgi:hypothetical protein